MTESCSSISDTMTRLGPFFLASVHSPPPSPSLSFDRDESHKAIMGAVGESRGAVMLHFQTPLLSHPTSTSFSFWSSASTDRTERPNEDWESGACQFTGGCLTNILPGGAPWDRMRKGRRNCWWNMHGTLWALQGRPKRVRRK